MQIRTLYSSWMTEHFDVKSPHISKVAIVLQRFTNLRPISYPSTVCITTHSHSLVCISLVCGPFKRLISLFRSSHSTLYDSSREFFHGWQHSNMYLLHFGQQTDGNINKILLDANKCFTWFYTLCILSLFVEQTINWSCIVSTSGCFNGKQIYFLLSARQYIIIVKWGLYLFWTEHKNTIATVRELRFLIYKVKFKQPL